MIASSQRKLYVVTRRDLPPAVRVVMAMHVAVNFAFKFGNVRDYYMDEVAQEWGEHGPPIIFLTVKNQQRLDLLAARENAVTYSDPDLDDGIDAIAIFAEQFSNNWARIANFAEAPDA